ncbi:adenylate/guanylate cyclase domain-containing protein [Hydrogenophaga laconesensis]|uniref:TolB-like protein/class 3 adenylate cyclase/Tfp pilus assembly protein PilF n=1 Tax=Hydrogenophaga laconesensis TaxID=1805971 RepID=A0ABU1VAA4_9BURK|nr:adenylate/guanylate cyclase domain-containing protein [Hydrogenophaga laconesensis]MDR7094265.1 TolB-like protein/class 3 adenylate cyclase/Tfp pilus assembly protein PilF [Hydrogenophaga laconesensis]
MTARHPVTDSTLQADQDKPSIPPLPQQRHKVVLVIDLVESVRLMAANEAAVVNQWRGFMHHATTQVLPACHGRLVKSLGDGMLVEFDQPTDGVRAALALHKYFAPLNETLPPAQQLHLRAGLNATHLYVDENDVYGHGVNLAARVADLASPGETLVTTSVFDGIVVGVDAEVEDRGESYLKHWPEPVRTWHLYPVSRTSASVRPRVPEASATDFRPSIAVVPFETRSHAPEQFVIGELIADGVISQLARSQNLRVISRMSTTAFRGRQTNAGEIGQHLDANFVLGGSYVTYGDKVVIMAELSDRKRGEVIWAERLSGDTRDLLETQSQLLDTLCAACARALLNDVVQRTLVLPVPQLDSNALMLGGITLMHRSTPRDLQRSQQLLEAVVERHKRVATPWAWMAKWHIMQVVQGLSGEPARDFKRAIDTADRALDLEPNSSLAMAIKGHALCHLGEDVDASHRLLQEATQSNPNDPMAWLYNSVWSTMWGTPEDSMMEAEKALHLSPLDPQKYYFEMMLANSYLAMERLEEAVALCRSSLAKNRYHLPTLRAMLISQYELGHRQDARETFELILALQPDLTLSKYTAAGSHSRLRQRGAKVFAELGLRQH